MTTVTSSLSSLMGTAASSTVGTAASDSQMNEFLQLLTTQLQNQDPTQPTDPTQFVGQLAQFSAVEQEVKTNSSLGTINTTLNTLALSQYSGMINHTVTANATSVAVPASGNASALSYNVTASSLTNVHLAVQDASGNTVGTVPVTSTTGSVSFNGLDTSGNRLSAGTYAVQLLGTASNGSQQTAGTLATTGTVSSVTQGSDGSWELQLQDGRTVEASTVSTLS